MTCCMGSPGPEYAHAWALYFAKFVQSYRSRRAASGGSPSRTAMATRMDPVSISRRRAGLSQETWSGHDAAGAPRRHISCGSYRDLIIQRAQTIFDDPEAAKYVWGSDFTGTRIGSVASNVRQVAW